MQEDIKHLVFGVCVAIVLLSVFAGVASAGDKSVLYAKAAASGVKASTWVEGHITEDTTWTLADSPYLVIGDVFVDEGATLTVEPGVTVKFGGYMSIFVNGSLYAVGTDADKITFTSNKVSPEIGDWNTIKFQGDEDETFVMKYNTVEYGTHGVTISSIGNSNTQIKSNTIRFNQIGISSEDESIFDVYIANNIIIDNYYYGIYLKASAEIYNITINDNTISSNHCGIYFCADIRYGSPNIHDITVNGNIFSSNNHYGIYLYADTRNDDTNIVLAQ